MDNPYLELTAEFNEGRLRAVLSSGQAVVLHRLAVMSKYGDWILRPDQEAIDRVLSVLGRHEAFYRFGAPLDLRWLAQGWSAHFEFRRDGLRVRCDFVTNPPRLSADELARVWEPSRIGGVPVVDLEPLAELKKTDREKDYAVIGELARHMTEPEARFRAPATSSSSRASIPTWPFAGFHDAPPWPGSPRAARPSTGRSTKNAAG